MSIGVWAIFITQFVSWLFINARNIAQPGVINEFNGMPLFSWLVALPALVGAASTLLTGKFSDVYGRRTVLLLSMGIFLVGLALTAFSTSMVFFIAANVFMAIGHWPIIPLCFAAVGDLFGPAQRAKWTGLLSVPAVIAATIGPVLGGLVSESAAGWRGLYWGAIPFLLIAGGLVAVGLPKAVQQVKPKIDTWGILVMLAATSTLIIGVSGLRAPGQAGRSLALVAISAAAWIAFSRIEERAVAPILDPQVLFNRTFLTAAAALLLSCFAALGITAYSPIFAQSVMRVSPVASGSMLTPYTVLFAFIGIAAGLSLARSGKHKWLYNASYACVTVAMFAMWRFTAATTTWWYVLVTSLAAVGLGALGTTNTLVAQLAVPRRLRGEAVGAMFFFQMIGLAVGPAILGLVQNSAPDLASGIRLVFLVGAVAALIGLVLIATIPELAPEASKEEVAP